VENLVSELITPFHVAIDEKTVARTLARLRDTIWPQRIGHGGWELGIGYDFMRIFVSYWAGQFDWRKTETELNAWPQYKTTIEDVGVHFYHVRGEGVAPRPLLLTHGWPGSVFEFLHLIGPLTQPSAYGGRADDAFSVVIPSLPGFGFSDLPDGRIIGPETTARLWRTLMVERLGYQQFGVQGGDFGAVVSICMAHRYPEHVVAMHLNTLPFAARPLEELNEEERAFLVDVTTFLGTEFDYFNMQRQKTSTVGFALSDNPLGIAAWILEKFHAWSDHDGDLLQSFTLDQLCANVSIYAFTNTIDTSVRMYNGLWTELSGSFRPPEKIMVPTGAAVFPREVRAANPPRGWAELQYNIQQWTEMPRGGHFAALEQPALFLADIRTFFSNRL
jgi:pimeloyl-ACP methyl ester carboxylesterase